MITISIIIAGVLLKIISRHLTIVAIIAVSYLISIATVQVSLDCFKEYLAEGTMSLWMVPLIFRDWILIAIIAVCVKVYCNYKCPRET